MIWTNIRINIRIKNIRIFAYSNIFVTLWHISCIICPMYDMSYDKYHVSFALNHFPICQRRAETGGLVVGGGEALYHPTSSHRTTQQTNDLFWKKKLLDFGCSFGKFLTYDNPANKRPILKEKILSDFGCSFSKYLTHDNRTNKQLIFWNKNFQILSYSACSFGEFHTSEKTIGLFWMCRTS